MIALTGSAIGSASLAGCLANPDFDRVTDLPRPVGPFQESVLTLQVYEDYMCPACRQFALETIFGLGEYLDTPVGAYYLQNELELPEGLDANDPKRLLAIEPYDYPIPVDATWSWKYSEAARAVLDLYDGSTDDEIYAHYWEMKFSLYERQDNPSYDAIREAAEVVAQTVNNPTVEYDSDELVSRVEDGAYRPVVDADRERGQEVGVTGTPYVLLEGEHIGQPDVATLSDRIDAMLARELNPN